MGKNLAANTTVAVAGMGAEALQNAGMITSRAAVGANIVVQPAVWVITGTTPDAVDIGLYGGSVASGIIGSTIGGVAFAVTSVVKGFVDDDIDRRRDEVRVVEPIKYSPFIKACYRYGSSGAGINAMTVASRGGTAWEHPNGIWVYITDAQGVLVCDYMPKVAKQIYQPMLPLRPAGNGFRWHSIRGGA